MILAFKVANKIIIMTNPNDIDSIQIHCRIRNNNWSVGRANLPQNFLEEIPTHAINRLCRFSKMERVPQTATGRKRKTAEARNNNNNNVMQDGKKKKNWKHVIETRLGTSCNGLQKQKDLLSASKLIVLLHNPTDNWSTTSFPMVCIACLSTHSCNFGATMKLRCYQLLHLGKRTCFDYWFLCACVMYAQCVLVVCNSIGRSPLVPVNGQAPILEATPGISPHS